jgi:hypothetical protein
MPPATIRGVFVDSNEDDSLPPDDSIDMGLLPVNTWRTGCAGWQEIIGCDGDGLECDSIQLKCLAGGADCDWRVFEELREHNGPVVLHADRKRFPMQPAMATQRRGVRYRFMF